MHIFLNIFFLVAGFALLIKGADVFVDASSNIAKILRVPGIVIGLTIAALGTSLPEAVVSISAALRGANGLAIGNVVGSNLFNLAVVVGLCAAIKPMPVSFKEVSRDYWVSVAAAAALLIMMLVFGDAIPRLASAALFIVFIIYMVAVVRKATKERALTDSSDAAAGDEKLKPMLHSICFVVLGGGAIVAGGQLAVVGAIEIATVLGMTERVIGLTVVALGTSLPELVISVVASRKKEIGIAVGNVIGSNIFNLLFVVGLSGAITPLAIDIKLAYDFAFLIVVSLAFMLFSKTSKSITRSEGIVFVLMYSAYMVYTVLFS